MKYEEIRALIDAGWARSAMRHVFTVFTLLTTAPTRYRVYESLKAQTDRSHALRDSLSG